MNIVLVLLKLVIRLIGLPTTRAIRRTSLKVKSSKVKVTRPTDDETESASYSGVFGGGGACACPPFGVRNFFWRFITNKLKIYEFMLC